MKPFFSYYGAKYQVAKHLGAPRSETVIEPFAGSACYSTRWNVKKAKLYDVSENICLLWDFLINSSCKDIMAIPSTFKSEDEIEALEIAQQLLCKFWVAKGRSEPTSKISPWYFKYNESKDCSVWGDAVKARVCEQKPLISQWEIQQSSYENIPNYNAHWHIDPPYNNKAGSRYPFSEINYEHLANWCRSRNGQVDVCENSGASWLPFEDLCEVVSSRGRRTGYKSKEAVWRKLEQEIKIGDAA